MTGSVRGFRLLFALFIASAGGRGVDAQPRAVQLGEPTCGSCRISHTLLVTLGDTVDALMDPGFNMARGPDGRIYVAPGYQMGKLLAFEPDGTFIEQIGRQGQGPGEYGFVRHIVPVGERVLVLDNVQRRITVLGPDYDVVDTWSVGSRARGVRDIDVLPDGRFAVAAVSWTPSGAGSPYHIFSNDFDRIRAFGGRGEVFRRDISWSGHRLTDVGPDGSIWGIPRSRWMVERWDTMGTLLEEFTRDVEWFRPHARNLSPDPDEPPPPLMKGVHADAAGRLWVVTQVADRDWAEAITTGGPHGGRVDDSNRFWDSIIQVIDVDRGVLLVSEKIDPDIKLFGSREYAVYVEEAGVPKLQIWRMELEGDPTQRQGGTR